MSLRKNITLKIRKKKSSRRNKVKSLTESDIDTSDEINVSSKKSKSRKSKTKKTVNNKSQHKLKKRKTTSKSSSNSSDASATNSWSKRSRRHKKERDILSSINKCIIFDDIKLSKRGKKSRSKRKRKKIRYQNIEEGLNVNGIKISKKKQMERERELKSKQLQNVPSSKKLRPGDIHRIVQHTDTSIFDEDKCCLWTGYITNLKNKRKGTYINFYFRDKKKVALHRLLYANFKGDISSKDYIKYSCANKGKCCNINHMVKFEYNSNEKEDMEEDCDTESEESEEETFMIVIY